MLLVYAFSPFSLGTCKLHEKCLSLSSSISFCTVASFQPESKGFQRYPSFCWSQGKSQEDSCETSGIPQGKLPKGPVKPKGLSLLVSRFSSWGACCTACLGFMSCPLWAEVDISFWTEKNFYRNCSETCNNCYSLISKLLSKKKPNQPFITLFRLLKLLTFCSKKAILFINTQSFNNNCDDFSFKKHVDFEQGEAFLLKLWFFLCCSNQDFNVMS